VVSDKPHEEISLVRIVQNNLKFEYNSKREENTIHVRTSSKQNGQHHSNAYVFAHRR
jgi:hypothetical protein